jgi:hypothetical protein
MAQITVVAQIVSISLQATNCLYRIDDGTGNMEARQWVDLTLEGIGTLGDIAYANLFLRGSHSNRNEQQ